MSYRQNSLGDQVVTFPAAHPANQLRERLKNVSNENMKVDGSSSSVEFTYAPGSNEEKAVYEIQLLITTDTTNCDNSSFLGGSKLTNGCKLEVRSEGTLYTLATFQQTEDLFEVPGLAGSVVAEHDFQGLQDLIQISWPLPGILLQNSESDYVKMTIQDDLTTCIDYLFRATVLGEAV